MDETIARLKADIAAKGIRFFDEIDQAALAAAAGTDGRAKQGSGCYLRHFRIE